MKMFKKFMLAAAVAVVSLSSASMAVFADEVVLGDVTADGAVTLDDAQKVLKLSLGIEPLGDLLAVADVDGSGAVDLTDAQKVLKLALGITEDSGSDNSGNAGGVTAERKFQYVDEEKKVSYNVYQADGDAFCLIRNNNSVAVDLTVIFDFCKGGEVIHSSSSSNFCFESGNESVLIVGGPVDSEYNPVEYDSIEVTINLDEDVSGKIYGIEDISYKVVDTEYSLDVEFTNNSENYYEFIKVAAIFYDADMNIIGADYSYADCNDAGTTEETSFFYPYDEEYNNIVPASYEIFINCAYAYVE